MPYAAFFCPFFPSFYKNILKDYKINTFSSNFVPPQACSKDISLEQVDKPALNAKTSLCSFSRSEKVQRKEETMGKTTVNPGNSHYSEGGRMPSTTGNPSGANRGNNPPASHSGSKK